MAKISALVVLGSFYFAIVAGNPDGAPAVKTVCEDLKPNDDSPHKSESGSGGYSISTSMQRCCGGDGKFFTYEENEEYTVTIATSSNKAAGYLIQAWDSSKIRIGTFNPTQGNKILNCSSFLSIPAGATLTHSEVNTNDSIVLYWTAPSEGSGMVDFRYTIVANNSMYFGPFSAAGSADGVLQRASCVTLLSICTALVALLLKL